MMSRSLRLARGARPKRRQAKHMALHGRFVLPPQERRFLFESPSDGLLGAGAKNCCIGQTEDKSVAATRRSSTIALILCPSSLAIGPAMLNIPTADLLFSRPTSMGTATAIVPAAP